MGILYLRGFVQVAQDVATTT
ncbi:DNA topoisomerase I [Yoonia vestfoldensis SKA53]|uniref:DNA topoisomerase I n=1 Tax=Yoonia vestfoldensis SKA53 TaxID=314232 RepID=A3V7A3_9RHOB|nr:DNA topoisomerase I [Yoonia vestfoldensis SKA53]